MKSLASWLISMIAVMYWLFRVVFALLESLKMDVPVQIANINIEIILLFVTLVYLVFIFRRNLIFGLLYFLTYAVYFGMDIYRSKDIIFSSSANLDSLLSPFISFLGITISFLVFADIVFNRYRGNQTSDKKTDWFFENEEYTRKLDERADKNEYKF